MCLIAVKLIMNKYVKTDNESASLLSCFFNEIVNFYLFIYQNCMIDHLETFLLKKLQILNCKFFIFYIIIYNFNIL